MTTTPLDDCKSRSRRGTKTGLRIRCGLGIPRPSSARLVSVLFLLNCGSSCLGRAFSVSLTGRRSSSSARGPAEEPCARLSTFSRPAHRSAVVACRDPLLAKRSASNDALMHTHLSLSLSLFRARKTGDRQFCYR